MSKFERAGFLLFVVVFVLHDFEVHWSNLTQSCEASMEMQSVSDAWGYFFVILIASCQHNFLISFLSHLPIKQIRLRWYGHDEYEDDADHVQLCMMREIEELDQGDTEEDFFGSCKRIYDKLLPFL